VSRITQGLWNLSGIIRQFAHIVFLDPNVFVVRVEVHELHNVADRYLIPVLLQVVLLWLEILRRLQLIVSTVILLDDPPALRYHRQYVLDIIDDGSCVVLWRVV
jgi:hypothetical protein